MIRALSAMFLPELRRSFAAERRKADRRGYHRRMLTPDIGAQLCALVATGLPLKAACALCEIPVARVHGWSFVGKSIAPFSAFRRCLRRAFEARKTLPQWRSQVSVNVTAGRTS